MKTEWGDSKGSKITKDFGFCDHGYRLQTTEEAQVYTQLKAEGYTVHKHGWPDFMATRGKDIRLIEVKASSDLRREHQQIVSKNLAELGAGVEMIIVENEYRTKRIHLKPAPLKNHTKRVV